MRDELGENQASNFVLPSNNSFNREKMSLKLQEQQPSNVQIAFETNLTQVDDNGENGNQK